VYFLGFEMEGGVNKLYVVAVLMASIMIGCGGNPYLDASLDPAEMEGRSQEWFLENWGKPNGKSARFFGGESWVYTRIAGGKTRWPFSKFTPNKCQIILNFNKEGRLDNYKYTDC
jgi:hypothetical protein